jgi:hypothetical protein
MQRCETDLSPGGRTRPVSGPEAAALSGAAGVCDASNIRALGKRRAACGRRSIGAATRADRDPKQAPGADTRPRIRRSGSVAFHLAKGGREGKLEKRGRWVWGRRGGLERALGVELETRSLERARNALI